MSEIIESAGSVYADLEYENADEMAIKAQLVQKISQIITDRKWTRQQAADVVGLPRPKLSGVLNGQFRGVSEAKLMACLNRLGRDVQIMVGPEKNTSAVGRTEVVSLPV